ncbi:MAG: hypothetical protein H7210_03100 [Pyrinomonadaceae bacterium]|nr:hypothetical protein [Phycisphaerales bacterium]
MTSITRTPGQSFDLDITLTSDAADQHNSAIFRVVFSSPGLVYQDYEWSTPYVTGGIFDDCLPPIADLPVIISPQLVQGPGFPAGVSDIELSNVVGSGTFGVGLLARLTFLVPSDYAGADQMTISVAPDTFARGFDEIPTLAGTSVLVTIPAPVTSTMLILGLGVGVPRRRQCA